MTPPPLLRLDWCGYNAALYAVRTWHYSKSLPTPPLVRIGVWESGEFIGCVLFSRGANKNLGTPYGLGVTKVAELARVALADGHHAPVSQILGIAIRLLKKHCPGLRLIISFADVNQGHHGGIYQASNWVYTGRTSASTVFCTPDGRVLHGREVSLRGIISYYGKLQRVPKISDCVKMTQLPKHRYLYPLDRAMAAQIRLLAQPYPHRVASIQDAPMDHIGEGGAAPTATLTGVSTQCHVDAIPN